VCLNSKMKFSGLALATACVVSLSTSLSQVEGFVPSLQKKSAFVQQSSNKVVASTFSTTATRASTSRASSLQMSGKSYTVGIVGATGAVGKEIRSCLEDRGVLGVDKLRIFGSKRSAGTKIDTKYGSVEVELFDVAKARECDVVFLAVDGDFALEHAKAISDGDDGAVVIDNSVSASILYCSCIDRNN
jgi:hypothetical protein